MIKKRRAHLFVSGRVQGVFFRVYARNQAQELGLTGWIRNLPDGRVEALLEGDEENIKKMIKWAKIGSPGAQVADLKAEMQEHQGEFKTFQVR